MKISSRVLHLIVLGKPEDTLAAKPPNLFEKLHTKDGLKNAKYWFKKHALKNGTLDESTLANLFRDMTDLNDHEIFTLLDIFDEKFSGTLSWKSFYLVLASYTALLAQETSKFMYKHGEQMFALLARETPTVLTFKEFASFGLIFGIREDELVRSLLSDFKINSTRLREQPLSYEDFSVYYFSVLQKLDVYGTALPVTAETMMKTSPVCACTIS
jgi:hypothetical protein